MSGPDLNSKFVMNNGVVVPLGKKIDYKYGKDKPVGHLMSHSEYIAYNSSQIRMRYLIQIEE